ncbi:serine/threonine-protein kinase [Sorangium sp. KYC3313]|uniref:serine/threonine-protein kinase n=1 Tax=Sorangium sp. KYC3313 TaxID=3449740 RepID=UPI003F8BD905
MLASGSCVGRFELVRRVASGSMSEVYEGREAGSGRPVAVKVLRDAFCMDADTIARFLNEARMLERVRDPHIVGLVDCGRLPGGPPFMALEWLPASLHDVLASAGSGLSLHAAARVASQIAHGLLSLHERGIVHRDLKPANVLLDQRDPAVARAKLADLGLAKMPRASASEEASRGTVAATLLPVSTGGAALLGTCEYMAPEQWLKSKDVEPKADVYALGVLLFQMLTGQLPFVGEDKGALMCLHLFERPPLHLLDHLASEELRDLITRMLSKRPWLRPDMREVLDPLARFL